MIFCLSLANPYRGFCLGAELLVAAFLALAPPSALADDWVKPNDPAYRRYPAEPHQENLFLLNMEEAWKIEKGSKDVVIAVIDWAFDVNHPDLKNQLWSNPGEVPDNGKDDDGNGFADDIHGWDIGGIAPGACHIAIVHSVQGHGPGLAQVYLTGQFDFRLGQGRYKPIDGPGARGTCF